MAATATVGKGGLLVLQLWKRDQADEEAVGLQQEAEGAVQDSTQDVWGMQLGGAGASGNRQRKVERSSRQSSVQPLGAPSDWVPSGRQQMQVGGVMWVQCLGCNSFAGSWVVCLVCRWAA